MLTCPALLEPCLHCGSSLDELATPLHRALAFQLLQLLGKLHRPSVHPPPLRFTSTTAACAGSACTLLALKADNSAWITKDSHLEQTAAQRYVLKAHAAQ